MARIELRGLSLHGFPVAALAAYGLLRVLTEKGIAARLGFDEAETLPRAFLEAEGMDERGLVKLLCRHALEADPKRYGMEPGLPAREQDDRLWEEARRQLRTGEPAASFLVAYLNPWWQDGKGFVWSPLDTTGGNQSFSEFLKKTLKALQGKKARGALEAAFQRVLFQDVLLPPDPLLHEEDPDHPLFGDLPGVKWHPSQKRSTADQAGVAREESGELTLRISPAAVLLAWEAFPLYPFPPGRSRLPLGFAERNSTPWILLPTPAYPVSLDLLRSLIALGPRASERSDDLALWASPRHKGGIRDYPVFMDAQRWDSLNFS